MLWYIFELVFIKHIATNKQKKEKKKIKHFMTKQRIQSNFLTTQIKTYVNQIKGKFFKFNFDNGKIGHSAAITIDRQEKNDTDKFPYNR